MSDDSLRSAARQALERAKTADASTLNEANTKALLIEPMLSALGWDMYDLEAVTREYRVYDGTFLDYALLVSKRPALFCEAKPTRMALDDPKWVSQTINYANNEGVVWCVLTDGLRWRVFKANEAAPMEKKLAFEVTLAELFAPETATRAEALFHCLTPAAVAEGELARLGTQVFVDSRVQDVLAELLEEPPAKLVDLVRSQMGDGHGLKPADVRGALARVAGPAADALRAASVEATPSPKRPTAASANERASASVKERSRRRPEAAAAAGEKPSYSLADHPSLLAEGNRELFEAFRAEVMSLGPSVSEEFRKIYVSYRVGRPFVEVVPRKGWLQLSLNMPFSAVKDPAGICRDVSGIGKHGAGDVRVLLRQTEELPYVMGLVRQAFDFRATRS